MTLSAESEFDRPSTLYLKETLEKGQPATNRCFDFCGQTYVLDRGLVNIVSLEDEWYEDLRNPLATIEALKEDRSIGADLLTFWQRIPDVAPHHVFHTEWEDLAVLPIKSYDHWWKEQIKSRTRNLIRKAEKEGIVIKETTYDDEFVRGMTKIFNETPVRQGRKFWHYGKDFEVVKKQFSRFIHREEMIGAYYHGELIGFMMLGIAGGFGLTGQIISAIEHRDKATNNALIAKAVEVCEKRNLSHLVYLFWGAGSLSEFKRRCGFEKTPVPRYYVPLTQKGKLALKAGIHKGWKELVPTPIKDYLKKLRTRWYNLGQAESQG